MRKVSKMFHVKERPVNVKAMADEVLADVGRILAIYRNTQVSERNREFLLEAYTPYSHTMPTCRHLNRNEIRQLKQTISEALNDEMSLRHEKLNAHQFKSGSQHYVIVSAYLYAYELYAI